MSFLWVVVGWVGWERRSCFWGVGNEILFYFLNFDAFLRIKVFQNVRYVLCVHECEFILGNDIMLTVQ